MPVHGGGQKRAGWGPFLRVDKWIARRGVWREGLLESFNNTDEALLIEIAVVQNWIVAEVPLEVL